MHEIRRTVIACSEVHLASSCNVLRLNRSNAGFEWTASEWNMRWGNCKSLVTATTLVSSPTTRPQVRECQA
jgi:hypothetical protein